MMRLSPLAERPGAAAHGPGPARSARLGTPAAAALYLAISFVYFGVRVVGHFGSVFIGSGTDPQIFAWALAWWPHALGAGENPVVTHALWTPVGSDLAWATAVPALALPLAPVTLLAGPIAAYNLAAVLLPAAAALSAFLLCRHLTGTFWPSLAGGYLFGFSTYVLGHEIGHLHLTAVFTIPLVALVLVRFLEGELGRSGLVVRLGPLLGLQFALATEVFFTLSLAIGTALLMAALTLPGRRPALRSLLLPLLGCYAIAFALVSPLLYYALTNFQTGAVTPTNGAGADLLNFAFPTQLSLIGGDLAQHFDPALSAASSEVGQYVGLPALLIIGAYLWQRRRAPVGRFLAACFALALVATLGVELRVRTVALIPLPWRAVVQLPLFDNVITGRLSVYVALLAAVMVALWAASAGSPVGRSAALVVLAVVAIVPDLRLGVWHQRPEQPRFFAAALERNCLHTGENTLLLPPPMRNEGLLWQAEDAFRFSVVDAGLNAQVPANLPERAVALALVNNKIPRGGSSAVLAFARAAGVGAVVVDTPGGARWRRLLGHVLPGRAVGGVTLYSITRPPRACRSTSAPA